MDNVRRNLNREQWKALIFGCRLSGMPVSKWCKANGLNVFAYLECLLLYMPDTDWQNHPKLLDDLIP